MSSQVIYTVSKGKYLAFGPHTLQPP